ncbi:MAG: DUF5709 domain-containing protein [Propionibacteriaceae bacterium]|jgi:hypothetical protein|nr:DUF5709 domain-containing protein [Propionibacteriaceae bacterium]
MSVYDVDIPDDSEQLDQLQPDETLVDRGVDDVLDEGYTAPERWSVAMRESSGRGDSIDQRLSQEEPDFSLDDDEWADDPSEEVGSRRSGRLVDGDADTLARDVGLAGGAASAEEAAMHVIDGDD